MYHSREAYKLHRNYNCRIREVLYNGIKQVNLDNELLHIGVLAGKGSDIFELFRVILLGGEINTQYSFTYGNNAMTQLKNYKADKAILSVDGISSDVSLTTYHAEEAVIDKMMIERSRKTIIVADYTKLGHESFSNIGDISSAHSWVTNECVNEQLLAEIKALGIEVVKS